MNYMVLEHLSGPRATQFEEFPLSQYKQLIVGRDASADVRFAESDVVGRQHVKISRNPADPTQFLITDLNSRNGTFLNRHRVVGTAVLKHGDIVQCGAHGPEFRFELQPTTEPLGASASPTRPMNVLATMPPVTPVAEHPPAHQASSAPARPPAPMREPTAMPGAQAKATNLNKSLVIGGVILLGLVGVGGGIFAYRSLTATDSSETAKTATTPQPAGANVAGKANNASPDSAAGEAENDAQRTAWRIEVSPYMTLGSGHPGKAASDFDKPDGVAFSPKGVLYATDAKNRRVQVWDVKTGKHLGEFGHGIFGGEIVDIAVAPNDTVYITDQTLNLAYTFVPPLPGELDEKGKPFGPYDYHFKGTRFGEQQFKKLGGITIDSRGRVYVVDAHRNEVRRFNPDNTLDKTFKFEAKRADGDTYLHGCEGVAIDESAGNLFIASEKDAVIEVFDWETGAYKHRLVGANLDATEKPAGKHIFFGSVEGLTFTRRHLMAVDESAGHIQLFDLDRPDAFNNDLAAYASPQPNRPSGYQGFFGHGPLVNFEDKADLELQKQVKVGSILPGQANPPGYFCSPDSIASYNDEASGETYIAIADQCNYRLAIYRWSDISKALGQPIRIVEVRPASQTGPPTNQALGKVASSAVLIPAKPVARAVVTRKPPASASARNPAPNTHAVHQSGQSAKVVSRPAASTKAVEAPVHDAAKKKKKKKKSK